MSRIALTLAVGVLACMATTVASMQSVQSGPWPAGVLAPPSPPGNPTTPAKIGLGKRLFMDVRLSGNGARSCATCHIPERAFADALPVMTDLDGKPAGRNTPTILNALYMPRLMWDGRFKTLEEQALQPLIEEKEMHSSLERAVQVVQSDAEYVRGFAEAFGGAPTAEGIAKALAAYERSLVTGDSPFDRYVYRGETDALTATQKLGFQVYMKANCLLCHEYFHPTINALGGQEAPLSDFSFHNLGIGYENGKMADPGRYNVTKDETDIGAFRTPTLRNVAITAPYMHDGSLKTLEEVVFFYNRGGNPNPHLDPSIAPLNLSREDLKNLLEFLEAFTSPEYARAMRSTSQP